MPEFLRGDSMRIPTKLMQFEDFVNRLKKEIKKIKDLPKEVKIERVSIFPDTEKYISKEIDVRKKYITKGTPEYKILKEIEKQKYCIYKAC